MAYVEKILQPDERVVARAHVHWAVFIWPVLVLIAALAVYITSARYENEQYLFYGLLGAAALIGLLGLRRLMAVLVERLCTELVVTDRRVIAKVGFIRRHTWEINNSKVEGVQVNQSVLGRVLNFGSILVKGTGGGFAPVRNIADPLAFRSHMTAPAAASANTAE